MTKAIPMPSITLSTITHSEESSYTLLSQEGPEVSNQAPEHCSEMPVTVKENLSPL